MIPNPSQPSALSDSYLKGFLKCMFNKNVKYKVTHSPSINSMMKHFFQHQCGLLGL